MSYPVFLIPAINISRFRCCRPILSYIFLFYLPTHIKGIFLLILALMKLHGALAQSVPIIYWDRKSRETAHLNPFPSTPNSHHQPAAILDF